MPRPGLRRLPSDVDPTPYWRAAESLPQPCDLAEWFGREAPWEVELGSGKGLFLCGAAAAHPERNYLGLEMARKYALLIAAKLARQGLTNARVIAGDGLRVFREWLPAGSVAAVHVYFPDPWWKARHKKRRVMNSAFVRDAQRVLLPGGTLHFWTDVEEYYHAGLDTLRSETALVGPFEVPEQPAAHDLDYRTHFERRTRLAGQPVYRAEFRKPGGG